MTVRQMYQNSNFCQFYWTFSTLLFSGINESSRSVHRIMAALLCELTVCQNCLHWESRLLGFFVWGFSRIIKGLAV